MTEQNFLTLRTFLLFKFLIKNHEHSIGLKYTTNIERMFNKDDKTMNKMQAGASQYAFFAN